MQQPRRCIPTGLWFLPHSPCLPSFFLEPVPKKTPSLKPFSQGETLLEETQTKTGLLGDSNSCETMEFYRRITRAGWFPCCQETSQHLHAALNRAGSRLPCVSSGESDRSRLTAGFCFPSMANPPPTQPPVASASPQRPARSLLQSPVVAVLTPVS